MQHETRYGFPKGQWERAKAEADAVLRECARKHRTTTYGELCRSITAIALKPRSWAMMAFLDEVCAEADAAHSIVLATLVVRADTGRPGEGYFRHAARCGHDVSDPDAFWRSEAERVFAALGGEDR